MKKLFFSMFLIWGTSGIILAQNNKNISEVDSIFAEYELDQITISATRYPEQIMEIPYAVSLIPNDKLQGKKGYGLDEVLSFVPGVLAQSRYGNQDVRLTIRGFGARGSGDRSNAGTSRGIRILVDGFPETEPDGRTSFDQIDLNLSDNIEVIRSNASALWGNAAGGLISISSLPKENSSFVNISGLSGNYGLQYSNIRSFFLMNGAKGFASLSSGKLEGWRIHSSSSRTILNAGIVSSVGSATSLGIFLSGTSNIFHIPGPLTKEQFNADPQQANPTYQANDERRFNRLGRLGVSFEHSIDNNNQLEATAYINPKVLQRSERNSFRDFNRYHTGGNLLYRNISTFGYVTNNLTIGADEAFQDGAILFYNLTKPANYRGTLKDNKKEGANSFGAFFQDEIIYRNFSLIWGGRYDDITYYNENYMTAPTVSQERSFTHFTPKLGLTYRLSPLHSLYVNYGGGVEVPAGNETDPSGTYGLDTVYLINPLLDAIVSSTVELGSKQIIPVKNGLIRFFSLDAALYYISVKNDIIPYQGGKFYFTAGRTTRKGLELGFSLQSALDITLDASLSYSINKYTDYVVDSVHYNKPGKFGNFSNNKVAGLPDYFYSTALTYTPAFLEGFYVNLNLNGVGDYFADDANSIDVPSYTIINASVGINELQINPHLNIKAFISFNNIADRKYAASSFINPDREAKTGRPIYLEPGLPRNALFSVSFGFK